MSLGGTCAGGPWSLARMCIALLPMSRGELEVSYTIGELGPGRLGRWIERWEVRGVGRWRGRG